jgi:L-amino acid N-acyltransferase YncA
MSDKVDINLMRFEDWEQVKRIYQQGIDTGNATFSQNTPEKWEEWTSSHISSCNLILKDGCNVAGWASLSPISSRCVYSGVGEVSIYMSSDYRGKGFGELLLTNLIKRSEENGIWTLQAGIFPENKPSVELHKKCGLREVGSREKLGKMAFGPYKGKWRDVLLLERRSNKVGIT